MSSSTSSPFDRERQRRGRIKALGIFLVCLVPFVAAYVTYYFWTPDSRMNYGELLPVRALPEVLGAKADGTALAAADLRGKWVLVQADSGACPEPCLKKLYHMRQVRLAQGKNLDRVERVWLVLDNVSPSAPEPRLVEGVLVVRPQAAAIAAFPADGSVRDHVYLVDPMGNIMLRFPKDADPRRMLKDLQRLLKVSQVG
ncbi:MAG: cytochrome C oxidase subunit I [Burkholderiales bacterium]|jgi:cytochrome oxidase Cu insertion factor (SCO1/SenC/PrrC family)|nr:cytochrome C oxidase subunit I [Burkholderiales bacterium]